ncbi:hypothetical protein HMSSN036_43550 [Paenibacillus macerans]|nr:hypothetical protein HMSSN036_43550 [Paenibacillus macerans]
MKSHPISFSKYARCLICVAILSSLWTIPGFGAAYAEAPGTAAAGSAKNVYELRRSLYKEMEILTQIPWYWLAAVDQYERTITPRKKQQEDRLTGIRFKEAFWAGPLNPDPEDRNPATIGLFGGIGKDATSDGAADPKNDRDALFTMASYLLGFGYNEDDFRIALWRYYQSDSAVERIRQFAKLYKTFGRLDLSDSAFPLPLHSNYTYRDTWGDRRGWGGEQDPRRHRPVRPDGPDRPQRLLRHRGNEGLEPIWRLAYRNPRHLQPLSLLRTPARLCQRR